MKKIFIAIASLFFLINNVYSQCHAEGEIYLVNNWGNMLVKVIPISMTMNGNGNYCLLAQHRLNYGKIFDYNVGNFVINNQVVNTLSVPQKQEDDSQEYMLNFDNQGDQLYAPETYGSLGPGIYKFVLNTYDSLIIEYDGGDMNDIYINHESDGFYFKVCTPSNSYYRKINYDLRENYYVQQWDPYPNDPLMPRRQKILINYIQGSGKNFKYNEGLPPNRVNPYNVIPMDPRLECTKDAYTGHISQNQEYPEDALLMMGAVEERHGVLTLKS